MATASKVKDLRDELPKLGLRNHWYAAAPSKQITKKPTTIKMLGEDLVLFRDAGKAYALDNYCPHRAMRLSEGKRYFPGTITCVYHGWTFDVKGKLVAALNEGPNSPLPGKVSVRAYPLEERNGYAYVWMGKGEAKPLEYSVPADLLDPKNTIHVRIETWNCNWMPSIENLQDSHDTFTHRASLWYFFRRLPAWVKVGSDVLPERNGVEMRMDVLGPPQDTYAGIGKWPRQNWWRKVAVNSNQPGRYPTAELMVPSIVRVGFAGLRFIRYMVPVDENHVRGFLFTVRHAPGIQAITYRLYYHLWASWALVKLFIGQDKVVFEAQDFSRPERLASSDVGIVKWRRLLAEHWKREREEDFGADRPEITGRPELVEDAERAA